MEQQVCLCSECEQRATCKKPCERVEALLWDDNRVMERHFQDRVVCYPRGGEVHFSELEEHVVEHFSDEDDFKFSSEDVRLRKTAVFIDRYFNKISTTELAKKYGVVPNTIVSIYRQAVEQVEAIVGALDSREKGLKAVKGSRFTDHQKWFLLNQVFGFSCAEVAIMFGQKDNKVVAHRVALMSEKFGFEVRNLGDGAAEITHPDLPDELTGAAVVDLVAKYQDQGLSITKAAAVVSERWADHTGHPVHWRAVESRYRRAQNRAAA